MNKNKQLYYHSANGCLNGYYLGIYENGIFLSVYDMDVEVEQLFVNNKGERVEEERINFKESDLYTDSYIKSNKPLYDFVEEVISSPIESPLLEYVAIEARLNSNFDEYEACKMAWISERKKNIEKGLYDNNEDLMPYYFLQNKLKKQVIHENELPHTIRYVAGVDVAYNDKEQRMVGTIVILDTESLKVVDKAWHEVDINFPYVPGLFSFKEVPPILEAYQKLQIKPDLMVCNAQGIAHPKGVGMATHLGCELNIPTIGCAKKRLVGVYEKSLLGYKRGATQKLRWDSQTVGVALRTQTDAKPMFVSIGHKINLDTAIEWVLKLCPQYRLPETTLQTDQLVNQLLNERTEIDFLGDS